MLKKTKDSTCGVINSLDNLGTSLKTMCHQQPSKYKTILSNSQHISKMSHKLRIIFFDSSEWILLNYY